MRKWTLMVTSFLLALGLVALANAQQGGRGFGGGFGGMGGGRSTPSSSSITPPSRRSSTCPRIRPRRSPRPS